MGTNGHAPHLRREAFPAGARSIGPCARACLLAAALLGASCIGPGTTESIRYYALSPVAAARPAQADTERLGVMPVRLPGYLDRPALVERRGAEIVPRAFGAWAAPLDQEFARVLAENLQRTQPAYDVEVFPWRRSFAPQQRLDVDVARFEVEDGAAILHARWRVRGENGNGITASAETRIRVPVGGEGDAARVEALSTALGQLSSEVSAALGSEPARASAR